MPFRHSDHLPHSLQMNGPEEPSGRRSEQSAKTDTRQNVEMETGIS